MNGLTKTDLSVIKFASKKLKQAGFNIDKWDLKEIPVEDQVYTFQNFDDTTEFQVFAPNQPYTNDKMSYDSLSLGYYMYDKNDELSEHVADTVQEAIENASEEDFKWHRKETNSATIFRLLDIY